MHAAPIAALDRPDSRRSRGKPPWAGQHRAPPPARPRHAQQPPNADSPLAQIRWKQVLPAESRARARSKTVAPGEPDNPLPPAHQTARVSRRELRLLTGL